MTRDDPPAFDATVNIGRLTMTGLIDTRDDLVDATRGQSFSSTFEYGGSALGSDIRYLKQLDVGKPADRRPTEPSFRSFASIGQAF